MAAPVNPTANSIVTEALKKAGNKYPSTTIINRGKDHFLEEVKHEIWTKAKKLKSLQTVANITTTNGLQRYLNPTDFSSYNTMESMHGSRFGTAQAGASDTITLTANESSSELDILGKEIAITSGTGKSTISVNGVREIISYNTVTKVATVDSAWATNPDSTSEYLVIDNYVRLAEGTLQDLSRISNQTVLSRPTSYIPQGNSADNEFLLYPIPRHQDAPFVIKMRYYADLTELDLDGALMATLYKRWMSHLIQGVKAKALEDIDDNRSQIESQKWERAKQEILSRETYGVDMSNLNMVVEQYGGGGNHNKTMGVNSPGAGRCR